MSNLKGLENVTLLKFDVVDSEQINAAMDAIKKETGGALTYLINNAGRNHFMPILDEAIGTAKKLFDINVWGTLVVAKAFAPLVIKAQGTVVHITSITGYSTVPYMGKIPDPSTILSSLHGKKAFSTYQVYPYVYMVHRNGP